MWGLFGYADTLHGLVSTPTIRSVERCERTPVPKLLLYEHARHVMNNEQASTHADAQDANALIETPERLRRLVRGMPSLVMMLDREGHVLARSDRWTRVFVPDLGDVDDGRATDDDPEQVVAADEDVPDLFVGDSFFDLFDDPHGRWHDALAGCLHDGRVQHQHRVPLRMRDGGLYWVDWEARPWTAPDDSDGGALLYVVNRTEQHRAESTRRQVERRFDALVDTISEGVLLMDSTGVFRDCNAAAEHILSRPASDIVGTKFNDPQWRGLREDGGPLPNTEFPFWRAYYERSAIHDEVMGIYPPEEPPRWIRVNAQPLFRGGDDDPYAVLISFDDITEEQLTEEALQTSRDLLSSVLSTSLDGIFVFTTERDDSGAVEDFTCALVNPQAEKFVGRSAEELVGNRLLTSMPMHRDNGLFEAYQRVVETGEPFETEIQIESDVLNGWFQVVAVQIEDGCAVTMRDVTERKEAVQAMAAANEKLEQRNRALRDFAYIASHDLQEPLRKISAFSNLVVEDYGDDLDETGRHYLARMEDAAQRMSQLISDLLVYSRVTTRARPFEPVDLNEIVDNVTTDLAMQISDVDGTVDVDDLPRLAADPTQMRQLLQNLISNGLKFHRDNVPPVVSVQGEVVPRDETREMSPDAEADALCRLIVEDNGIGFDPKYADRIFSPFKRLHGRSEYTGTGMGLAICNRIVERHHGDISVRSAPDEGTTFTILLPIEHAEEDSAADSEPNA